MSEHSPELAAPVAVPVVALPPGLNYDLAACRELMRGGSKSFFAASLLLPARLRAPATALYAFCRLADDAIDLGTDSRAAMRDLQSRLDAIYAGRPGAIDASITNWPHSAVTSALQAAW